MKAFLTLFILYLGFFESFGQNCKPAESNIDKITDENVEFYGGKLEDFSSFFSKLEYRNRLFINFSSEQNAPILVLAVTLVLPTSHAHLMEQNFEKGSKIAIRTTEKVHWLSVDAIQKSQLISGSNLYTTYFLNCNTSFNLVEQIAKSELKAYQFTNTYNEIIQGEISGSRSKSLTDQYKCFLAKYKKM